MSSVLIELSVICTYWVYFPQYWRIHWVWRHGSDPQWPQSECPGHWWVWLQSVRRPTTPQSRWEPVPPSCHGDRGQYDLLPGKSENNGRNRLSVSTTNRTHQLSEGTRVTPFHTYRFNSTGLCVTTNRKNGLTGGQLAVGTDSVSTGPSRIFSARVFRSYVRVSRGLLPRFSRYGLLYFRTVEYDNCCYVRHWSVKQNKTSEQRHDKYNVNNVIITFSPEVTKQNKFKLAYAIPK